MTNPKQAELLNCPFCLYERVLVTSTSNKNGNYNQEYVKCLKCFARGPKGNRGTAENAWNTRSRPSTREVLSEVLKLIGLEQQEYQPGTQTWLVLGKLQEQIIAAKLEGVK